MKYPLVSIIVPVYNVERYLNRCVNSIITQEYKELEIILVDDGSRDGCPLMCDKWAEQDKRIKVIHQNNGGLSVARNAGLDIVSGEYIAFVDSDDYLDPRYIDSMLAAIISGEADMAICSICIEDNKSRISIDSHRIVDEATLVNSKYCLKRMHGNSSTDYVAAWNKLYSSKLWATIRFPRGRLHEDESTIYKIIDDCDKIAMIPQQLYHYVQNIDSIMHADYSVRNLDCIEAWVQRLRYYQVARYRDLYAMTFNQITWDLARAHQYLDWNDDIVHIRLQGIFRQLQPFSFDVMFHVDGWKNSIRYIALCSFPFQFYLLKDVVSGFIK